MKKTIIIIELLIIIVGGIIAWGFYVNLKSRIIVPVACTQEAKLCPDGSAVVKSGPNCEFEACPETSSTTPPTHPDWLIKTDTTQVISFQYPKDLGKKYITAQTWPPKITVSNNKYVCNTQVNSGPGAQSINEVIYNDQNFCEKSSSQGAAGSIYTDYEFSTEINGKLVTASFTIHYPQCDNYPEPQKSVCQSEKSYMGDPGSEFNIEDIMNSIVFNP